MVPLRRRRRKESTGKWRKMSQKKRENQWVTYKFHEGEELWGME